MSNNLYSYMSIPLKHDYHSLSTSITIIEVEKVDRGYVLTN
jgi:hypothetical protein